MNKRQAIRQLEDISEYNSHVGSLLRLYKGGYKSLDDVMLEMVSVLSFESYILREEMNELRSRSNKNH